MKLRKTFKKYLEHLKKVKLVIVLPLVFIFVFVFGSVLRNIILATGTPWVQTDWREVLPTINLARLQTLTIQLVVK
jgi:hypothetical protein